MYFPLHSGIVSYKAPATLAAVCYIHSRIQPRLCAFLFVVVGLLFARSICISFSLSPSMCVYTVYRLGAAAVVALLLDELGCIAVARMRVLLVVFRFFFLPVSFLLFIVLVTCDVWLLMFEPGRVD